MRRSIFTLGAACVFLLAFSAVIQAQEETDLPQIFDNGHHSFRYPADWVVLDYGPAQSLATDESVVETGSDLSSGNLRATVIIGPVTARPFELPPGATAADLVEVLSGLSTAETCGDFGEPATELVNKIPVTTILQSCSRTDNLMVIADLGDDDFAIIMASAPLGEIGAFTATLTQIAAMATVAPPLALDELTAVPVDLAALTETFASRNGAVTFRHPAGWMAEEGDEAFFGLTDGPQPLFSGSNTGELIAAGQLVMILTVFPYAEIPAQSSGSAPEVLDWLTADGLMDIQFVNPAEFTLDGRHAASAELDIAVFDARMVVIELPGVGYVTTQLILPVGELERQEATLYAVLASVAFDANAVPPSPYSVDPARSTQVYANDQRAFRIRYPDNWQVFETEYQGVTLIVLTPGDGFDVPPAAGEAFALLDRNAVSILTGRRAAPGENPAVVALEYLNATSRAGFTSVEGFEYEGKWGARSDVQYGTHDVTAVILMLDSDNYIYANCISAPDEMTEFFPAVLAMLNTAEVLTPTVQVSEDVALTQTYLTPGGRFALDYPNGWHVEHLMETESGGADALVGSIEDTDDTRLVLFFIRDSDETLVGLVTPEEDVPENFSTDGVHLFDIDGRPAGRYRMQSDLIPILGLWDYVIDLGNQNFLRILIGRAPFEHPDFEPTVLAILASARQVFTVDASLVTEPLDTEEFAFTLAYPQGWAAAPLSGVDATTNKPTSDPNRVQLTPPQGAFLIVEIVTDVDLAAVYALVTADFLGQPVEMVNRVDFEIGGRRGFRVDYHMGEAPMTMATYALELEGGGIAQMTVPLLPTNIADVEPLFLAILASVQPR